MRLNDVIAVAAPLALDELVALPDLQTRIDRKYVLTPADAAGVLTGLADWRVLDVVGQREFAYHSRYFDTPELDSFRSSATGRRRRFKVRIRTYVADQRSTLEVKTKGLRGVTVKRRLPLGTRAPDGVGALAGFDGFDGFGVSAAEFIDRCVGNAVSARLSPIIDTAYHRSTFVSPCGPDGAIARATIDMGVGFSLPQGPSNSMTDDVIIETKAPSAVTELDRMLWARGIRPVRVSKFGVAMVLGYQLAGNRWNRVLREHCDWAPLDATLSA